MAEDEDPHTDDWPAQARQSFLTAMWNMVVDEDAYTDGSPSWIESRSGGHEQGSVPGSASAAALHRILACGVNPDDVTDVVRQMQHDLLYNVCQLIDDPGLLGIGLDEDWSEQMDVRWELVAVRTARSTVRAPIDGLHSSLDELDPSGRSGEPRGRPVPARLPGQPLHARLAIAHARAGYRIQAINTWRKATGASVMEAKAAIDQLLDQLRQDPESAQR
ncbi:MULTISPECIES: hypothetical protein [unclassified Streptomyces]|uniref:hypothetical protein n=1 Tax=unclassified Streptomyces TaxID=2593676 RepID=UPI0022505E6A|nr:MULTISPECIES: hypothetical protein [unclassified Streptomyces]MCX4792912.1 hypothetical protein [Streptomyces sp. NBC_01242]WSP59586.1 hypothetical protein OG306_38420 [Streptomyces sp. NBC_01241]WSP60818.1 hypothetical protein OG466_02015 [Streptomyces sp. NBC_01240]